MATDQTIRPTIESLAMIKANAGHLPQHACYFREDYRGSEGEEGAPRGGGGGVSSSHCDAVGTCHGTTASCRGSRKAYRGSYSPAEVCRGHHGATGVYRVRDKTCRGAVVAVAAY